MRIARIVLPVLVLLAVLLWLLSGPRRTPPPVVSLLRPAENAELEETEILALEAEATATDGLIARVVFRVDGETVGSVREPPYIFNVSGLPPGEHRIEARATDERGRVAESPPRTVRVRAHTNLPPVITLLEPADGFERRTREPLVLRAGASDPDGEVAEVAFLLDGRVVGRRTSRPFSISLSGIPEGAHTITARATDERGATSGTDPVGITVAYEALYEKEIEAEAGVITHPMVVRSSPEAFGGKYIMTTSRFAGGAHFIFEVDREMAVVVWCRVISPDLSHDSFYVQMDDGPRDVFDVAEGQWSSEWQWVPVNGRGEEDHPLALDPRVFRIGPGRHRLRFFGRETMTALDRIVITSHLTADYGRGGPSPGGAPGEDDSAPPMQPAAEMF